MSNILAAYDDYRTHPYTTRSIIKDLTSNTWNNSGLITDLSVANIEKIHERFYIR